MDLNMEVLISRSPGMGVSDSVTEDARNELSSMPFCKIIRKSQFLLIKGTGHGFLG